MASIRSVSVRNYGDQSPPIHRAGGAGGAVGNPIGLSGPPPACRLPVRLSCPDVRRRVSQGPPHPARPLRGAQGRIEDSRGEALVCGRKRLRAPNLPTTRGLEVGRERRYATRVLRCTPPRPERRVEGGRDEWAFGNPSSYVVTGGPLTDIQADG